MAKKDLVLRRTVAVTPDTYERLSKVAAEMQLKQPGNVSLTMALAALLDLWDVKVEKYRVKIPCYHYNTGSADNYSYVANHDFDTKEEAEVFKAHLIEQYTMVKKYEDRDITYEQYSKWADKFKDKWYEVEDGYVTGLAKIVKFVPEQEIKIE